MEYQYFNQFNLSNELAQSISSIISQKEKEEYICKIISVTIPEHKGLVFRSPLDGYIPYGGGLLALNGAQMQDICEKYGKYVEGTIPAEEHSFLAVMKKDDHKSFSELSFKSKEEIERALQSLSVIFKEYNGIFDSRALSQRFPYLQDFFDSLDEWRAQTERVTIDKNVLEKKLKKSLGTTKSNIRH